MTLACMNNRYHFSTGARNEESVDYGTALRRTTD
jgi:hypothetical protein